jgi:hypothetical protein
MKMPDDTKKPDIKLVDDPAPESIFDNIDDLRRTATLKVSRKVVTVNVAVKRPANNIYFRVNPDPNMSLDCSVVMGDGGSDDFYFVVPRMLNHHTMLPRLRRVTIAVCCIWPGGNTLLWPVPQIDDTTRVTCWKSARAAYGIAQQNWVQLVWNTDTRDYDVAVAEGIKTEPTWPADKTFVDLLKLGFGVDKIINNENHPYVLRLRGLAE